MGLWGRFTNWLFSPSRRATKRNHPDLYPLEVNDLVKELGIEIEAKKLGEAKLPAAENSTLSGPEAIIVQRMEKARRDYVDWAAMRLGVLNADLTRRDVITAVNRALQADKEFERKASTLLTEQESLVRNLGESARKRQAELDEFRRVHGLTRDANYPTAARTFLGYAILVGLAIFEGGANSLFFSQGLNSGLIGGFLYALLLATLNVVVAFALGKFPVRLLFHHHFVVKLAGLVFAIFAFALMLVVGLTIAHFRDSLTAEMADPAKAAWEVLKASPFRLRDVMSLLLLMVSLVFAIIALLDGLFSDDIYPGYGRLSRRTAQAVDEYDNELTLIRRQLEELKDEQLKTLDEEVQSSRAAVAIYEKLIQDKKTTESRLSTALRDAENCMEALLRVFRSNNEIHRGDAPRPVYFDTKPNLQPMHLPDFKTASDEVALERQRELVTTLLEQVEGLRGSIQASFNQQFDRLKPLDMHFAEKEVS